MSDPMVIAGAVVIVVTALTTAAVTIISAVGRMKVDVLSRIEAVNDKADTLVRFTNGTTQEAAEQRAALEHQIATLHAQLAALQRRRIDDVPPRPDPSPERGG